MKPMLSDAVLRDAVMKELDDDPEVAAKHISVTAIDGAITLGGHVRAISVRREVSGAVSVSDRGRTPVVR